MQVQPLLLLKVLLPQNFDNFKIRLKQYFHYGENHPKLAGLKAAKYFYFL
jgi:hypothetical protein